MKSFFSILLINLFVVSGLLAQSDIPPPPPPPPAPEPVTLKTDSTKPRLSDYIKEIEQLDDHDQKISFAFWLPWQYWQTALTQDGGTINSSTQEMIDALKNYTIVFVTEGSVTPFGISYKSESEIRDSIELVVNDSLHLKPIDEENMNQQVQLVFRTMGPMMKSMLGQMGEHLCFFAFENVNRQGKMIVEAQKPGKMVVSWKKGKNFVFRLPLDVLTPPKYCPLDGEKYSGKFNFCPYHGVKLLLSKK